MGVDFRKSAKIDATASKIVIDLHIMAQNDHDNKPVMKYSKNYPFCLFLSFSSLGLGVCVCVCLVELVELYVFRQKVHLDSLSTDSKSAHAIWPIL